MESLDGFPIQLSLEDTLARLRIDKQRAEKLQANEIFKMALSLIHPRALFVPVPVTGRTGGTVSIGTADFTSRILAKNLDGRRTVFPYVLTIGEALETEARASTSVAGQFLLDELGNTAIESSINHLQSTISQEYGLKIISHMSPGQLDWSISQQRELFSLFGNVEDAIGVRLTDSLLMIPRKSVSGIMFPTEVPFVSCQLCRRPGCASRKAPYDEDAGKRYATESVQGC